LGGLKQRTETKDEGTIEQSNGREAKTGGLIATDFVLNIGN